MKLKPKESILIEPAENGGYIVYQQDIVKGPLQRPLGAFTNAADLVEALADCLAGAA